MAEDLGQKPSAIEELKEIVEELARKLTGKVFCGIFANFWRHCQTCLEASGGAFEYFFD